MSRKFTFASLLGAVLLCGPVASAGGEGWIQDFEQAKEQARQENKDLLIDFTGSDWCSWCIRLNKEVFSTDEFKSSAPNDFVLVELDFPKDKSKLTEEQHERNEELRVQYGVEGYPTIFLADAEGRPYARTGYEAGGGAAYVAMLADLKAKKQARDEKLAAAEAAEGAERAALLDEALGEIPDEVLLPFYEMEVRTILAAADADATLDTDRYTAAMSAFEERGPRAEIQAAMKEHVPNEDWDGLARTMAALAEKHADRPGVRQEALFFQAIAHLQQEHTAEAVELLKQARDAAPESDRAEELGQVITALEMKLRMEQSGEADAGGGGDDGQDGTDGQNGQDGTDGQDG